jgi:hypothetical protein
MNSYVFTGDQKIALVGRVVSVCLWCCGDVMALLGHGHGFVCGVHIFS